MSLNETKAKQMSHHILYRNWNPFSEMDALGEPFRLLFGNRGGAERQSIEVKDWVPLVDILENGEGYLIKVELPEVQKKDVSVRVEAGMLSIVGERKTETKEEKVHCVERSYGRFVRSFRVPENADASRVTAEFKDGILRVSLPKMDEAKPKSIEVSVA